MALTKGQRKRIARYERDNRVAAGIILADTERHGGDRALAVQWARIIRSKPATWPEREDLFEEESETAEMTVPAVYKLDKVS